MNEPVQIYESNIADEALEEAVMPAPVEIRKELKAVRVSSFTELARLVKGDASHEGND